MASASLTKSSQHLQDDTGAVAAKSDSETDTDHENDLAIVAIKQKDKRGRSTSLSCETLAASHRMMIKHHNAMFDRLTTCAGQLSSKVVEMSSKMVGIEKRVEGNHAMTMGRMDEMERVYKTDQFVGQDGKVFMPYFPLLFEGSTGNNAWCPVTFVDHKDETLELVVVSVRACQRFYRDESQHSQQDNATMSWLFGSTFQQVQGLTYSDELKAYLRSGFSFLAAGPKTNLNRAENQRRLLITKAVWFKEFLGKIEKAFPDRPRVRAFNVGGKTPNYKADGVDYGFRSVSRTPSSRKLNNFSTGPIVQLGGAVISAEEKTQFPVLGEPWVQEWYTPFIGRFFDVPPQFLRKKHVVGGVVDEGGASVHSHTVGAADYWRRKDHQDKKKLKREIKRMGGSGKKKARWA